MKYSKIVPVLATALILSVFGSGCTRKPGRMTWIPGMSEKAPANPGLINENVAPVNPSEKNTLTTTTPVDPNAPHPLGPGHDGWPQDRSAFAAQTVYFEFDKATVKPGEASKLEAVAARLKAEAANAVLIEGHCDERGTEEYNRALGERRALALREFLIRLGIEPTRVDTKTFGEDRPAREGHDEAAYSKNRRGEFILLTTPK